MLQTEAKELFEAILRNQAAAFGLAKLSQLDLNDCFDKDGDVVVDGTGAGQTLLEFSVMQNRDNITRALCSAGADPLKAVAMSRFQGSKKDRSEQEEKEEVSLRARVKKHLASLPPALATYIVKLYVNGALAEKGALVKGKCEHEHCPSLSVAVSCVH